MFSLQESFIGSLASTRRTKSRRCGFDPFFLTDFAWLKLLGGCVVERDSVTLVCGICMAETLRQLCDEERFRRAHFFLSRSFFVDFLARHFFHPVPPHSFFADFKCSSSTPGPGALALIHLALVQHSSSAPLFSRFDFNEPVLEDDNDNAAFDPFEPILEDKKLKTAMVRLSLVSFLLHMT